MRFLLLGLLLLLLLLLGFSRTLLLWWGFSRTLRLREIRSSQWLHLSFLKRCVSRLDQSAVFIA